MKSRLWLLAVVGVVAMLGLLLQPEPGLRSQPRILAPVLAPDYHWLFDLKPGASKPFCWVDGPDSEELGGQKLRLDNGAFRVSNWLLDVPSVEAMPEPLQRELSRSTQYSSTQYIHLRARAVGLARAGGEVYALVLYRADGDTSDNVMGCALLRLTCRRGDLQPVLLAGCGQRRHAAPYGECRLGVLDDCIAVALEETLDLRNGNGTWSGYRIPRPYPDRSRE